MGRMSEQKVKGAERRESDQRACQVRLPLIAKIVHQAQDYLRKP